MKKRAITLLEVMIVILLIGIIGGVVSYNLKGTLDKGKAFSSKEGAHKLQDILNLELQLTSTKVDDLIGSSGVNQSNVEKCVIQSGLVSNARAFVKDGWKEPYTIVRGKDNTVRVWSSRSKAYYKKHNLSDENDDEETDLHAH